MRKAKLTTSRWRFPESLRKERFEELLSKQNLAETLGSDFVKGLEARRDYLETRHLKLFAWQLPILLFLALSFLNVDASFGIFGISTQSTKNLREVLLVLSTTLGLVTWTITLPLSSVQEMLQAVVNKQAKKDSILRGFLEVRYGIAPMSPIAPADDLNAGKTQMVFSFLAFISFIALALMLGLMVVGVQIANLIEVYRHPNFSYGASLFVIAYVLVGDLMLASIWALRKAPQPYQSNEDFKKLLRKEKDDPEAYQAIIRKMVQEHLSKGYIRRVLGRPKLSRLP